MENGASDSSWESVSLSSVQVPSLVYYLFRILYFLLILTHDHITYSNMT